MKKKSEVLARLSRTGFKGARVCWTDNMGISVLVDVEVPNTVSDDELEKMIKSSCPPDSAFVVKEVPVRYTQEEWVAMQEKETVKEPVNVVVDVEVPASDSE